MTKTKYYISFGQSHIHKYNKEILDCNILFCIEASSIDEASTTAKRLFENKWSMIYTEKEVEFEHFPRGVLKAYP